MENIFGYGSLVNSNTHDYGTLQKATLLGWRRRWHYTTIRDLAFLSVEPDSDSKIQGVVMAVPLENEALQSRESDYDRHSVTNQISMHPQQETDTSVFAIPALVHREPGPDSALLLSYIDVVVQGYHQLFGETGVQDFFTSTHGWGAQIINDRSAPIYPRYQSLSRAQTEMTDHWLNELSAVVK